MLGACGKILSNVYTIVPLEAVIAKIEGHAHKQSPIYFIESDIEEEISG